MEEIILDLGFQRWTEFKEMEMREKVLQTEKVAPPKAWEVMTKQHQVDL